MKKQDRVLPLLTAILITFNYLLGYTFIYPQMISILRSTFNLSYTVLRILEVLIYVFVFITTVFPARKMLRYGWERYTDNYKVNMKRIFRSQVCIIVRMAAITLVLMQLGIGSSYNQEQIGGLVRINPVLYTLMAVVFAPFVEEIVFRGCIYRRIEATGHKYLGYIVSSFIFGLVHVISPLLQGNWVQGLYIFVYGFLGMVMCIMYEKTDSLFCSILLHILNNAISLLGV